MEPLPEDLPFDLGGYRPDLIAFKNSEGIIVDVKTSNARFSIDKFQELAERIATHHGWKFMLVTLDDVTQNLLPEGEKDLPSWFELQTKMKSVDALIENGMLEPALLYLWSSIEAMLRKRAIMQKIPIDRFPPVKLLNHMYSSGEIAIQEFDLIKSVFGKRNRVAHGLVVSLTQNELKGLLCSMCSLLQKWQNLNG